jgi:uncharacterized membrane protein
MWIGFLAYKNSILSSVQGSESNPISWSSVVPFAIGSSLVPFVCAFGITAVVLRFLLPLNHDFCTNLIDNMHSIPLGVVSILSEVYIGLSDLIYKSILSEGLEFHSVNAHITLTSTLFVYSFWRLVWRFGYDAMAKSVAETGLCWLPAIITGYALCKCTTNTC